jgi:hypothetical protein
MISCLFHNKINQDGPTNSIQMQKYTLIRKLDKQPFPFDLRAKLSKKSDANVHAFDTERQMMEVFISKIF